MKKVKFDVTGMTCSACSARVEKAVTKVDGVNAASVNLLTNSMKVEFNDKVISEADIIAAVEDAGYGAAISTGITGSSTCTNKDIYGSKIDDGLFSADQNMFVRRAEDNKYSNRTENVQSIEINAMKQRLYLSVLFLLPTVYIAMHNMFNAWLGVPVPQLVSYLFDGPENAIIFALGQLLLIIPILLLNRKYFINGFRNLFHGSPNMDSLVGMGSAAAAGFGIFSIFRIGWGLGHGDMNLVAEYSSNLYFESSGMIVTLITVGKYLEAKAKGSTSEALKKLIGLAPKTAVVLQNGQESEIPVENVQSGDIVVVRPGSSIPVDGEVIEGNGTIDASSITGESIPVERQAGDKVISATLLKNGFIKFRATKVGENTTINQIIQLVDDASSSKAPIARLADKIAGIFVPTVIAIAISAGVIWLLAGAGVEFAFSIAISILVISCPCALGLATPVAIMVGIGKGAEYGILIKSGETLEIAHTIDTVVVDKTGTLTEGKPRVTELRGIGMTADDMLRIAVALEQASEHPLAEAVVNCGKARGIYDNINSGDEFNKSISNEEFIVPENFKVIGFQTVFGRGIMGKINEKKYCAGNLSFMQENEIDTGIKIKASNDSTAKRIALAEYVTLLQSQGITVLLLSENKNIIGLIGVADREKNTSLKAVNAFTKLGIDVVMLTGDNIRTAQAVAKRLGIKQCIADVMPGDKANQVEKLQANGHKVAMIGDGVNDSPALAKADLGIAIGAGTDVAIESADAVLIRNDLRDAVNVVRLSRAVIKNIKENLFWAFFYNAICIPLAAGVFYPFLGIKLSPMIGAAAMSLSSVCVVLNALRLKRFNADTFVDANNLHQSLNDVGVKLENISLNETVVNDGPIIEPNNIASQKVGKKEINTQEDKFMETVLKVDGMMCQHCVKHIHDALAKMDGVTDVVVSLEEKTATVRSNKEILQDAFKQVITEAGYELL